MILITIIELRRCFWRNRFADTPGLSVVLALEGGASLGPASRPYLAELGNRWPALASDVDDPLALIGALAAELQQSGDPDSRAPVRVSREGETATVFFGA